MSRAPISITLDQVQLDREVRKLTKKLNNINRRIVPAQTARALNKTGDRIRTRARRDLAKQLRIPQRLLKNQVKFFKSSAKALRGVVWMGLKRGFKLADLPGARSVIAGKHKGTIKAGRLSAKVFRATMPSGKKGQWARRLPSKRHSPGRSPSTTPNLPIEEPQIRIDAGAAETMLKKHAVEQMRTFYPKEFTRLLKLKLQK